MAVTSSNIFTQHSRAWRSNRYVYPVISRRSKGLSIGVNLNPDKNCNFDCVYCSVDRTVALEYRDVELPILRDELESLLALAASGEFFREPPFDQTAPDLRRINDVAFSGDGEPTSFPQFVAACEMAADAISKSGLADVKIVVITNATLLHRPNVQRAMEFLDRHNGEIWAKLDAGTQPYFEFIERTKVPLSRVLANLATAGAVRPIVIQSLFMHVDGVGPDDAEILAYVERLAELKTGGCRIKLVQVYTVARRTAEDNVTPLSVARLDAIAARIRRLGLTAETFYAPT
ncbi:radical SAM protein [soil metagenome]